LKNHRSPRQAADLLASLIDELGLSSVIVYGISAGGLTAIELAANHPRKVGKLILASALSKKWFVRGESKYKTAKQMFKPGREKLVWSMVRLFSKMMPRLIANNFYSQFSSKPKHKLQKADISDLISALENYNSGNGFDNDLDQEIDHKASLTSIKVPTLIIHSTNDTSVPFDHAYLSHELIKDSKIMELDNEWGHLFWLGDDSTFPINESISFIKENSMKSVIGK